MKNRIAKFVVAAFVCAMSLGLASEASATSFAFNDSRFLGQVTPGLPNPSDERDIINHLVGMTLGSSDSALGQSFVRSLVSCGTCTAVTLTGVVTGGTGVLTGDFGTGFSYLIGKYDGPNGDQLVWNVQGLTGAFDLQQFFPNAASFNLSHWALFGPDETQVPEPATLTLMGFGLMAIGVAARRRFQK
jgi:hypothetical protein